MTCGGVQVSRWFVLGWWKDGAGDGVTDSDLVFSNEGIASVTCVEESVDSKSKSMYSSVYVLTFTYSDMDLDQNTRSQIQEATMSFLHWVQTSWRVIWWELGEKSLLLFERSQLGDSGLFRFLIRIPPGYLPRRFFRHVPWGKDFRTDPELIDCLSSMAWGHLWVSQEELESVTGERGMSEFLSLTCRFCHPTMDKCLKM